MPKKTYLVLESFKIGECILLLISNRNAFSVKSAYFILYLNVVGRLRFKIYSGDHHTSLVTGQEDNLIRKTSLIDRRSGYGSEIEKTEV